MKYYLVSLTLILGEYEKTSRHFVEAEDKKEAELKALKAESHDDAAGFEDDGNWWDCGYQYVYQAYQVKELSHWQYETARKIISY